MNTLDDLRRTLDAHAGDVHDDVHHARTAAVRGRAAVVRRRRAAGVATAAALAVVGAVGIPQLVGDPGPDPLGAPDTRTALGWTYQLSDTVRAEGGRLTLEVEQSDVPRLVSWATDGADQDVVVRTGWPGRFHSSADDFGDHVQLPPGYEGTVRVTGAAGLSLATYTLDPLTTPAGVGEGPRTFREDVAGFDLLGAVAGEPGQTSVEFDLVPEDATTWVGYYCENLPKGTRMHVNWVGAAGSLVFGGCDAVSSFDPGGSPGTGFTPGKRAGTQQTLRLWVTRGGDPVADGEIPELRLGLGAYTSTETPVDLVGIEQRREIEFAGHVYRLAEVVTAGTGESPRLEVPEDGQFVVGSAFGGRGSLSVTLTADGQPVGGTTRFSVGGVGGSGETAVPAGSTVELDFGRSLERVDRSGLSLYERVD
jgi:hypothetical protein